MKPALFIAAVIVSLGTASSVLAACSDPAGPRVSWPHCNLYGADLTGATLRYAYLSNANLSGATLSGADLSGATWTDGRICAEGSRGACN